MQAYGQIYAITIDNINYIGQARGSSLSRWATHLRLLISKKHHCIALQTKYNEFGLSAISFRILKEKVIIESLNEEENNYTKQYNGINAFAGNYLRIEKTKLILDEIKAGIPYRKIASNHNVSIGSVSKIKATYLN